MAYSGRPEGRSARGDHLLRLLLRFLARAVFYVFVAGGAVTAWRGGDPAAALALAIAAALTALAANLHGVQRWIPGFEARRARAERVIFFSAYFVCAMALFAFAVRGTTPLPQAARPVRPPPLLSNVTPDREPAGAAQGRQQRDSSRPATPMGSSEEEDFYGVVTAVAAAGVVVLDGSEPLALLGVLPPPAGDPRHDEVVAALRQLAVGRDVRVRLWPAGDDGATPQASGLVWILEPDGRELLLNTELVTRGYALLAPPLDAPLELRVPGALPHRETAAPPSPP
jgi:hypothetical protein